jgi:hypothetical protein
MQHFGASEDVGTSSGARIRFMTTVTELKQPTSAMAANGFAAAYQATQRNAARTRDLVQNGLHPAAEAFSKASNGLAEFGRGNLEAVAQSAQAYLLGMQDLGRQYAAVVQGLTQHAFEGTKVFAGVRSPVDAMALQMRLTRASMERALSEGAKLQKAALALAEQVHTPLTQRATAALDQTKLGRAA